MNPDDQSHLEELQREMHRVGITWDAFAWDAFAEVCRLNAPNEPPSPDGSFAMELDYPKTTALLRTLPDRAGQPTFIAAWLKSAEPLRKRAEAASRAEEQKRRGHNQDPVPRVPNMRLKLSARGGRSRGNWSILSAAASGRSLSAIR